MKPILLELPHFVLYSYGATIVAAALIAGLLAWRQRPSHLFSASQFLNICLLTCLGSALGARAVGSILAGTLGTRTLGNVLGIWDQGHLSSLGVPVGVVPLLLFYLRHQKLKILAIFDHLIPFALLGGAMHRSFGCFLGGCCLGKPTMFPFGVIFPGTDQPVHPTQLYLGLSFTAIFLLLIRWHPSIAGVRSLVILGIVGLVHLLVQPFRAVDGNDLVGAGSLLVIYSLWVLFCGMGVIFLSLRESSQLQPSPRPPAL